MLKNSTLRSKWLSIFLLILTLIIGSCSKSDNPAANENKIVISNSELNFGEVLVNNNQKLSIVIENNNSNDISLNAVITGSGANAFSVIEGSNATISGGKSVTVTIQFSPAGSGDFEAQLNMGGSVNNVITLKGKGVSSLGFYNSPSVLNFGQVVVGESVTKTIIVYNTNTVPLNVKPALVGGMNSNFQVIYNNSGTIAPNSSDSVVVKFTPTAVKFYAVFLYMDESKRYVASIRGEGAAYSELTFETTILDFGTCSAGGMITKSIKINNNTNTNVTYKCELVNNNENAFSLPSQTQGTISAKGSITLNPKFNPQKDGDFQAIFRITSGSGNKYDIQLKGTTNLRVLALDVPQVSSAPSIDGNESDGAWSQTTPLAMTLQQVEATSSDNSPHNATIKAVHDNDYIYFLVRIEDSSQDETPNQFVFNGGDPNLESSWTLTQKGQDGFSFMFPVTDNVIGDLASETFAKVGCYTSCHTVKEMNNYEGGSYPGNGTVDIWYWKAGTTNPQGFSDDYYAMGDDGKQQNIRKGDLAGRNWCESNFHEAGAGQIIPISVPANGNNSLDYKKFIWDETSSAFNPSINPNTNKAWAKGDVVPGWKLKLQNNPATSRNDITAKGVYKNNGWTIEFRRKLNTGNEDDIILKKGTTVPFSVAYFNNSRQYSEAEYLNLKSAPRPGHFGPKEMVITLSIK